jgi:hypothetical protein
MDIGMSAFDYIQLHARHATRPLARPISHLPLALVVAGPGLPPSRFASVTRADTPSGASNYGF